MKQPCPWISWTSSVCLCRIAYRDIEQQTFIGRNAGKLLNLLFIEPAQDARTQPLAFGSQRNMSGGNADIYQREILVLNLGAQEGSDIHGFFHHQNMYRSIFGKLIHPQSGSGLTHFTASSGSVITTKRHGWALHAEGDSRAASKIRSNFSGSTARDIS